MHQQLTGQSTQDTFQIDAMTNSAPQKGSLFYSRPIKTRSKDSANMQSVKLSWRKIQATQKKSNT
jgi:hypothetical protein